MKVRCINATDVDLQLNEVYLVTNEDERSYSLERIDRSCLFLKTRFEVLPDTGVADLVDFRKKWGKHGERLEALVSKFILLAPSFPGDADLSEQLGFAMADLEVALK